MRATWLIPVLLLGACASASVPSATPGALTLIQLDLRGWIGESMLVVGPDGTTALIDVGNDGHGADIAEAVRDATGDSRVDVVLLTHYHEDHIGGLPALLDAGITVGALVDRGDVHLGAASGALDAVRETELDAVSLCQADGCALPWTLDLGQGATLTVLAADGQVLDARLPDEIPDDHGGENARSLVGLVQWGDFSYVFSGDLTGGGKGTPDVESFYAAQIPDTYGAGAELLHLGHHGINSSTERPWLDRWLSGGDRGAITGSNGGYLDAPSDEVLDRLRGRLGQGAVWVPRAGRLTGGDPDLIVAKGPVIATVTEGGAVWALQSDVVERFDSNADGTSGQR